MSPVLEKLRALDYEVLYMTEPLDELTVQSIGTYKWGGAGEAGEGARELDLVDAAKEDLSYLDAVQSEDEKEALEAARDSLEDLCSWLKETLGARVTKVDVSSRLTSSPAALVQSSYGMSPTMQRYMQAQAVASGDSESLFGVGAAALELNPSHPVVMSLKRAVAADDASAAAKEQAELLYDVAALTGGYTIDDPGAFAKRVVALMGAAAGSSPIDDAEVVAAPPAASPAAEAAEVAEVAEVEVASEPETACVCGAWSGCARVMIADVMTPPPSRSRSRAPTAVDESVARGFDRPRTAGSPRRHRLQRPTRTCAPRSCRPGGAKRAVGRR